MISIALPIHNMKNAKYFLTRCLDSLLEQTYEDFEVVITDNSPTNKLQSVCNKYGMRIRYSLNPRKGMAQNTNEAIKLSKGEIIKVIYMDDYLAHKNALKEIVEAFKGEWLVSGCTHDNGDGVKRRDHYPTFDVDDEDNNVGSPSVLTIRKGCGIFFDEKMTWLLDLDLYKRLGKKYGEPVYLDTINVVIGTGEHQVTHILTKKEKQDEVNYMNKKYAKTS
jgi:glycosyltransferase involved in cell wall biosynthesis